MSAAEPVTLTPEEEERLSRCEERVVEIREKVERLIALQEGESDER